MVKIGSFLNPFSLDMAGLICYNECKYSSPIWIEYELYFKYNFLEIGSLIKNGRIKII